MRAYPDWELKFMDGNDVHFQYKALVEEDPLYSAFWNRVTDFRETIVFGTVKEGLDMLQQERAVIHIYSGMLKAYFKSDPFRQQNLKTFAKGGNDPSIHIDYVYQYNQFFKKLGIY